MSLKVPDGTDHLSKWSATNPWKEIKHTPGAFPSSPNSDYGQEFLGQHSLASAVRERRQDYIRKKQIKIKIGTWNVASIGDTYKDLPLWFIKGLGVKGLQQNLAGVSLSDSSDDESEKIESVEQQENRSGRKSSTVPRGEVAVVSSNDDIGIYALGLQEVIDISSITEAMRPYYDPNPGKKWKRAVKKSIPPGYVKIAEQQLLGLLILVFASSEVASQVTSVSCQSVGTGAFGYVGNKGAVSVRLVLGGTTRLLFVNSHLAAGADSTSLTRRIWDTNQILSRTKFDPAVLDGDVTSGASEVIGDEDFAFWFGDLNFRLDDIPGEDVRRLLLLHTRNEYDVMNKSRRKIDSELGYIDANPDDDTTSTDSEQPGNGGKLAKESTAEPALDPDNDPASLITTIRSLLKHDQLHAQQRMKKVFHDGWREGDIAFLPTYKYDIGSVGMFDSGEKRRSPSWCDRILYRTKKDLADYHERTKQEAAARKRDDEMKAKGLDSASAEQEVLFDYDPTTDGADDYDEYDEGEDNEEIHPVTTNEGYQDVISLEDYIAHPRVLSSDHKPLSAVFGLTYDAVIPELRVQVQQEVARMFDKNENETRPNVTLVIDDPVGATANADKPTGGSELNCVEFGQIRYLDPITRTLDIANTGPIPATFAFIDRPVADGTDVGPCPSWMAIKVHHENHPTPKELDNLGTSTRFTLAPGDIATVDITINVNKPGLVRSLNAGSATIDDILVLRILDGRDHFVSVQGVWQPSCFYRYLDELVRFPDGVRSLSVGTADKQGESRQGSTTAYHSAPRELFDLTEVLSGLVERTVAEWAMTNRDRSPPWESNLSWPFRNNLSSAVLTNDYSTQMVHLREALDTGRPLVEYFDATQPPIIRAELLADLLVIFIESLQDGVVPSPSWRVIEGSLISTEKSKTPITSSDIQEMVMDTLSTIPIHSVTLTFITFMLTRIVIEISSGETEPEPEQTPSSPISRRARSSTEASEAPSDISVTSVDSTATRLSFLPSLSLRRTGTASSSKSVTVSNRSANKRAKYIETFSEFFADILIRSENDAVAKGKEKQILHSRKQRVIKALLDSPSV